MYRHDSHRKIRIDAFGVRYFLIGFLLIIAACTSEDTVDDAARKTDNATWNSDRSRKTGSDARKRNTMPPEEIVRRYTQAMVNKDQDAMADLLTAKAREATTSWEHTIAAEGRKVEFDIGIAEIDANHAAVPATLTVYGDDPQKNEIIFRLRQDDGRWGIYSETTRFEDGNEFTLNYEKLGDVSRAMDDAFKKIGQGSGADDHAAVIAQRARYGALTAITPEAFTDRWSMDLSTDNRPAGDILAELLVPMGLQSPIDPSGDLFSKPLTLNLKNKSRLELIERICEKLGYYPEYPLTETMRKDLLGDFGQMIAQTAGQLIAAPKGALPTHTLVLKKSPRKNPVVFTGPLMVEIGEPAQNARHATGSLPIVVYGTDIGTDGFDLLKDTENLLAIERITDKSGNSLFHGMGSGFHVAPYGSGAFFRLDRNILLKNLLRQVTHIDRLSGMMIFRMPTTLQKGEIRFNEEGGEKTETLDNLTLTTRQNGNTVFFEFQGPGSMLKDRIIRFDPRDAQGRPIHITSTGYNWMIDDQDRFPSTASFQLSLNRSPETVAYKRVLQFETIQYPFALESLALPTPETMPETLSPLQYSGHDTPATIEMIRIDRSDPNFPKLRLRITNHANKAIAEMDTHFIYLDENGVVLEKFPHSLQGTYTDTGQEALVAADAIEETLNMDFIMPGKTQDIRFRIDRIVFMDTAIWQPRE